MKSNKKFISRLLLLFILLATLTILSGCTLSDNANSGIAVIVLGFMITIGGVFTAVLQGCGAIVVGIISALTGLFLLIGELIASLF